MTVIFHIKKSNEVDKESYRKPKAIFKVTGLARKDHEIYIMVLYGQAQFIMIIELSGVKFGMKSYPLFQNRTSAEREFDLNHKYDFRPKLHDMNSITAPFS